MSSSLISPKLCTPPILTCKKTRFSHSLQITAHIPRDHEGRSSKNIVDANLHLLKVRMEEVRNKERVERCSVGWNYAAVENFKTKRNIHQQILVEFVELVGVVANTFGLTIFGCSFCLCLISLLLHFNQ